MKKRAYTVKIDVPKPPTVDELAALIEKRDRLSAECDAASRAVTAAIESVDFGTYASADGGIVCVYDYSQTSRAYFGGPQMKAVKFTRPLREFKTVVKVTEG